MSPALPVNEECSACPRSASSGRKGVGVSSRGQPSESMDVVVGHSFAESQLGQDL